MTGPSEGPWTPEFGAGGGFVISDKKGRAVCSRNAWPHNEEESRANGRLIGASLSMLNELKRQLSYLAQMKQLLEAMNRTDTVQYEQTEMREQSIRNIIARTQPPA